MLIGEGHAPEHACLLCEETGVLIAGDQILPRISPNISVQAYEPDGDPLSRYLTSLSKLRGQLPGEILVLPSHNLPFRASITASTNWRRITASAAMRWPPLATSR